MMQFRNVLLATADGAVATDSRKADKLDALKSVDTATFIVATYGALGRLNSVAIVAKEAAMEASCSVREFIVYLCFYANLALYIGQNLTNVYKYNWCFSFSFHT